ncbi:MAG: MiaB/RimO family radical SAM methylthiotransferase, partial [Firmicutes bacterium]|nr:MiaB/RimO family radical SAM methylthiotransferase [Bacillota bacterium]
LIVGVEERRRLPELVEELLREAGEDKGPLLSVSDVMQRHDFRPIAGNSLQSRARAYLKIEDGCDQFCRYCIIPYVRGPVRSLPPQEAVEQARRLLAQGHREIVLSGIHVGAYGKDLDLTDALPRLIESLCALPDLLRLRLGSVEPQQFTPELLTLLETEEKLCPHLHIPLQSGCDRTLAEMGRRYDTAFYAALLTDIRRRMDDPAITCDVMVGFPGETEADFAASRDFCAACGFADLHIFPYSRRSGTPAAKRTDQVRQSEKARRAAELAEVARQSTEEYARRWQGRELRLLVEERVELDGRTYLKGHSDNYLTLLLPEDGREEAVRRVSIVSPAADGLVVRELSR